jgi:hypothetical protein
MGLVWLEWAEEVQGMESRSWAEGGFGFRIGSRCPGINVPACLKGSFGSCVWRWAMPGAREDQRMRVWGAA